MADSSISDLYIDLQPWCKKLCADLFEKNIDARPIQTWRNPDYQRKLIAQGVTHVPPENDKHCFTLLGHPAAKAFDLGIFNKDGSYVLDGTDVRYTVAGGLWRGYQPANIHLVWGGSWSHGINPDGTKYDHRDYDHFEMA